MAIDVNIWITSFCRQFISNSFVVIFVRSLNRQYNWFDVLYRQCCMRGSDRRRDGNNEKETTFLQRFWCRPTLLHTSARVGNFSRLKQARINHTIYYRFRFVFGNIWNSSIFQRIDEHLVHDSPNANSCTRFISSQLKTPS